MPKRLAAALLLAGALALVPSPAHAQEVSPKRG